LDCRLEISIAQFGAMYNRFMAKKTATFLEQN